MARITEHYQIPEPVPFLDIDVSDDNRFFLDPHVVRETRLPQPFADEANQSLVTFFDEVTRCALSRSPSDRRRGLDLLQHFEEPWESRLGLSENGFHGHGGSDTVGGWIWEALTTDPEALLQIGMLQWLENLPIFVNRVDKDITSDITTRVTFASLANFTASMVTQFPQFRAPGHDIKTVKRQTWDTSTLEWTNTDVELPVVDDKPLLLVPRDWGRPTLLVSAGRFYSTTVLGFAQLEQAVRAKDGKLVKKRKTELRKQPALAPGRNTILRVAQRAHEQDEDLLRYFIEFVDERYEPLTDEEIARRVN